MADANSVVKFARKLVEPKQADREIGAMHKSLKDNSIDSKKKHDIARQLGMKLADRVHFAEGGVQVVSKDLSALRQAYLSGDDVAARSITDRIRSFVQPADRMLANQVKNKVIKPEQLDLGAMQTANRLNQKGGEVIVALERAINQGEKDVAKQIGNFVMQNATTFPKEIVSQVAGVLRLPSLQ